MRFSYTYGEILVKGRQKHLLHNNPEENLIQMAWSLTDLIFNIS